MDAFAAVVAQGEGQSLSDLVGGCGAEVPGIFHVCERKETTQTYQEQFCGIGSHDLAVLPAIGFSDRHDNRR